MDRVSQLQELLDKTVQDFAKALGRLQFETPPVAVDLNTPVTFLSEEQLRSSQQNKTAFIQETAKDMILSVKAMDYLIDNLPAINMTQDDQNARLRDLNEESKAATIELQEAVDEAAEILREIRDTRDFLARQKSLVTDDDGAGS
ncbi:uncharacterized protein SPPG_03954 [Spizellomyces punctatus DAOM BR117]|uniref:Mediator of RNA polymerase II transcription subunit 21 n=1 Tax=Spizellomyces punctatus (strain DAOM BR117) TaxID=645134 RepID=A0A0L0HIY1_SPIPD|nr:uncharacterized protein SPPG_03954 [Spizellomyces punctatus DAOM BR117]KND00850.1 hypothetical protein SPPG_03954 [Spizellomyces punctatus DAOM BR117]|eukprot:XP_016608889.1 hypothetical protein SPPG_03954 [Spizellomyces punctatus DAOM BR117]